jgi:hypothetical protein
MTSETKSVRCSGCERRAKKAKEAAIKVWRKVQTIRKGIRK